MSADRLPPCKQVVHLFYKGPWDHADRSLIPEIFHPDLTFRGSLGPVLVGHEAFAGHVDMVTTALGSCTCDILELEEEGETVSGKHRFHGIHRAPLFGHARPAGMAGGLVHRSSISRA